MTRKKQISILVTGSINFGSIIIISKTLFNSVLFQLRLWLCQVDTISSRYGRVNKFLLEKLHLHNTQTGSPQNNENLCLPVENITVLVLRNKVAQIFGAYCNSFKKFRLLIDQSTVYHILNLKYMRGSLTIFTKADI